MDPGQTSKPRDDAWRCARIDEAFRAASPADISAHVALDVYRAYEI